MFLTPAEINSSLSDYITIDRLPKDCTEPPEIPGDQDFSQSRETFATVTDIDQSIVDNADYLVSRIWYFAVRLLQLQKSSLLVKQSGKRPISL